MEQDKRAYILTLNESIQIKLPEIKKRLQLWTEILSSDISESKLERFFTTLEKHIKNAGEYICK